MPSAAKLRTEVQEAEAALNAAEEAARHSSPTYLKAQVELKTERLQEAVEVEESERQRISHDLSVTAKLHGEQIDAALQALAAYIAAREALAATDANVKTLLRQARAVQVPASEIPVRETVEYRRTRDRDLRHLFQRHDFITRTPW